MHFSASVDFSHMTQSDFVGGFEITASMNKYISQNKQNDIFSSPYPHFS